MCTFRFALANFFLHLSQSYHLLALPEQPICTSRQRQQNIPHFSPFTLIFFLQQHFRGKKNCTSILSRVVSNDTSYVTCHNLRKSEWSKRLLGILESFRSIFGPFYVAKVGFQCFCMGLQCNVNNTEKSKCNFISDIA